MKQPQRNHMAVVGSPAPAVPGPFAQTFVTARQYITAARTDVARTWEAHGWKRPDKKRQERMRLLLNTLSD